MDNHITFQASSDSAAMSAKSPPEGASWRDFIAVTKPGIIRSNLIAAFAGYWLASGWDVHYGRLVLTLLGTMLVMASACVFNNYFDRDLDMKMERTRERGASYRTTKTKHCVIIRHWAWYCRFDRAVCFFRYACRSVWNCWYVRLRSSIHALVEADINMEHLRRCDFWSNAPSNWLCCGFRNG